MTSAKLKTENTNTMNKLLTLPGIATLIVSNFDKDDKTSFKSMLFIINDKRYRHELDPNFTDWRKISIKKRMIAQIKLNLDIANACKVWKHENFCKVFDYLVDNNTHLYILGKQFGIAVNLKLTEFSIVRREHDIYPQIKEYQESLKDYLEWSLKI
jgi:hypothetical protein